MRSCLARSVAPLRSLMTGQKRALMKIGTHSGSFHCDEAFGCFLLKQLPEYKDAEIVRSRDPAVLDECDVVIDVGGVYDPDRRLFDHHQRSFSETFGHGFSTRLSSAGLVYKHFGRRIVASIAGVPEDSEDAQTLWLAAYERFVEELDAVDNGIDQFAAVVEDEDDGGDGVKGAPRGADGTAAASSSSSGASPASPLPKISLVPRYRVSTTLSARVGRLNPAWNASDQSAEALFAAFETASAMAGREFVERVRDLASIWLPGRALVAAAMAKRFEIDARGRIVRLDAFCPWKDHLHRLEAEETQARVETGLEKPALHPVLYVLYEDSREKAWRIQAVAETPESFVSRLPLPEAWRGLRDAALDKAAGIEGGIFVHASGFIGGAKTYQEALKLAQKSLAIHDEQEETMHQ